MCSSLVRQDMQDMKYNESSFTRFGKFAVHSHSFSCLFLAVLRQRLLPALFIANNWHSPECHLFLLPFHVLVVVYPTPSECIRKCSSENALTESCPLYVCKDHISMSSILFHASLAVYSRASALVYSHVLSPLHWTCNE